MDKDVPARAKRKSTPMMPEEIEAQKYVDEMSNEEAARYGGDWIAVWGRKVVAHGNDPGAVIDEAHKAGAKAPFITCIYGNPAVVPNFFTGL